MYIQHAMRNYFASVTTKTTSCQSRTSFSNNTSCRICGILISLLTLPPSHCKLQIFSSLRCYSHPKCSIFSTFINVLFFDTISSNKQPGVTLSFTLLQFSSLILSSTTFSPLPLKLGLPFLPSSIMLFGRSRHFHIFRTVRRVDPTPNNTQALICNTTSTANINYRIAEPILPIPEML